jgi:hypothetical protein
MGFHPVGAPLYHFALFNFTFPANHISINWRTTSESGRPAPSAAVRAFNKSSSDIRTMYLVIGLVYRAVHPKVKRAFWPPGLA